jgi:phage tail protein X
VPAVLDINPGLAALGPIVPAGTRIAIPAPTTPEAAPATEIVTLWSE